MLKIVLCDDNSNILEKLEKMLEKILTKHNYEASIVFKSGNSKEILNYVANNRVDILFLDINLGVNKSGLKLAEEIRKINKNLYIIFTTGHLEYVMVAYKYKTFDYLAKPNTFDRL